MWWKSVSLFLLDVWRALSSLTCDQDLELAALLKDGVPTGIDEPIPLSGVWEKVQVPVEAERDLRVRLVPWRSASEKLDLAKKLLQDDVDQGHAFIVAGGEAEARERWGNRVAAGKLGGSWH